MSDAIDRILLGRKRLVDAYTQQHESDAEAARAYAEDILRSDPLALTVAEAARRLSVSVSTIGAVIADKRLPCVRLVGRKGSRGRVLVRTADLDAHRPSDVRLH
jgi:excisionase family DNA binding protein